MKKYKEITITVFNKPRNQDYKFYVPITTDLDFNEQFLDFCERMLYRVFNEHQRKKRVVMKTATIEVDKLPKKVFVHHIDSKYSKEKHNYRERDYWTS